VVEFTIGSRGKVPGKTHEKEEELITVELNLWFNTMSWS
jgi:hypothetical protein